jgi:DNA-binding LacI/PurR family transcriptional regulator
MKEAHTAGNTGVLGLLGIEPDRFADPYFSQILHGVQDEAFEAGREILLINSHAPIPWYKMDAVLLAGDNPQLLADKPATLPCVALLYHDRHLPSVVVDDFEGVRQATERLIDLGHERIGYLSLVNHPITRLRIAGYQRALNDAGLAAAPEWMRFLPQEVLQQEISAQQGDPRRHFREWGYCSVQNWLRSDWEKSACTALLTQNDHVAVGALAAFQEAGISVPSEVSLVGFDDSALCECTTPTLSSIAIPLFEVGAVGVRSLLRELGRAQSHNAAPENTPETVVLPAHFQARDSIAAAP